MSNELQPRFLIASGFSKEHERALTFYLQDDRKLSTEQWRLLYEGINYLDQSEVEITGERFAFRQLYNRHIDQAFADEYLEQLIGLIEPDAHGTTLTAQYARKIAPTLEQQQLLLRNNPQSYLLFAYCVYWWQSFARGYAFEVELKRDLEASKIIFAMHDVRSRAERYSQADLIVLDLLGDIKTSPYFLQESSNSPLANDFYITRLYEKGYTRTLVVFQKPSAWQKIGGRATVAGKLENVLALLPQPVKLEQAENVLIVVEYVTWKSLVQRVQHKRGGPNA